jgi:cytidylate kinase
LIVRALDAIAQGGGETWTMGTVGLPPTGGLGRYDLAALIREAIEQTAARGNVVIVAHAASHVIAGAADALRVLVTASPDRREKRLAELEGIDADEARRKIKDADAGRRDYLKSFHGVDLEAPTHYDLVLNTDVLRIEEAARVVSMLSRGPERVAD